MPRKNHNQHPVNRPDPTEHYDVEYVFMDQFPEITMIVAHRFKTVYKNLSCAPWADAVHEVRGEADRYLMIARGENNDR